jgi:hypothetical protein
MAYGQTGAGKTYTIIGSDDWNLRGLVPRTIQYVFKSLENAKIKPTLQVSFLEIYNEDVFDLLDPENQAKSFFDWQKVAI